jgi:hypothetical protein
MPSIRSVDALDRDAVVRLLADYRRAVEAFASQSEVCA